MLQRLYSREVSAIDIRAALAWTMYEILSQYSEVVTNCVLRRSNGMRDTARDNSARLMVNKKAKYFSLACCPNACRVAHACGAEKIMPVARSARILWM
ncbi:MAG: hypothetical protein AWT59_1916 [Candidatus Gallionella acididurans]|uniref:Uncharacterized protein n=1 Tax=Candidatus Gallionella acididurans TaxID=1796491 RepID=A0A139BT71_9PROT|nr:MAG: hypothetical protein AWT59_1916 [Candidatus Gallionella acididurans]